MQVKKQYEELYALLQANQNKKVSTIMPAIAELMSRKAGGENSGNNSYTDETGQLWVFCYYHKRWENTSIAEYGQKKGTKTGLNTMCKEGVSAWTKGQRVKKQAEANLLDLVAKGELEPSNIGAKQAEIAELAKVIEPRSDEHGFESMAEFAS